MSSQPKCLKLLITTDIFDHSLPTLFFSYSFFYKASPQIVALNIVNPSLEWWPSDLCDTHRRSDVLKLQKQYLGLSLGNNVQYFFLSLLCQKQKHIMFLQTEGNKRFLDKRTKGSILWRPFSPTLWLFNGNQAKCYTRWDCLGKKRRWINSKGLLTLSIVKQILAMNRSKKH